MEKGQQRILSWIIGKDDVPYNIIEKWFNEYSKENNRNCPVLVDYTGMDNSVHDSR